MLFVINLLITGFTAFILLFILKFIIIPYLKVSSYKGRKGITTYFYPILGYGKYALNGVKEHGDVTAGAKYCDKKASKLMIVNAGSNLGVILRDCQYIREFIQKQSYYKKGRFTQSFKPLIGNGLLLAEGETWKRHRKIISNSFHFEFLKNNMNVIRSTAQEFLNNTTEAEYEKYPAIAKAQEITGEIIGRIFFGEHLNNYKYEGKILSLALANLNSEIGTVGSSPLVVFLGPNAFKLTMIPRIGRFIERINGFRRVCFEIVKDRKAHPQQGKDLLASLLATQELDDPEMRFSDEEIVNEFITFFMAGMDSTGHLIGMMLYSLTQYPEYLEILQEERNKTYNQEKEVTTETLHKMDVLNSLLKETLRFYTPAPALSGRIATVDHTLIDFPIKKGTFVMPELLAAPFDEAHIPDPMKFNPLRWMDPNFKVDPFAFMPFSAGPRNCIGQHLAIIDAKVVVSEFLEKFDFKLNDGYKLKMVAKFLCGPEQDIPLNLKPRKV